MKLHEFLRQDYPDAVLIQFLHVTPKTIAAMRADAPVSRAILRRVGRRLAVADTIIEATLARLAQPRLPKPKTAPPSLTPQPLPPATVLPEALPLDGSECFIGSFQTAKHHLVIVVVVGTPRLLTRVNRALYGDHWRTSAPCRLAALTAPEVQAFARSWLFHEADAQRFDLHMASSATSERVCLYLLAMQAVTAVLKRPVTFVYQRGVNGIGGRALGAAADALAPAFAARVKVVSGTLAQSLGLQAAAVIAHAAATGAKLPLTRHTESQLGAQPMAKSLRRQFDAWQRHH